LGLSAATLADWRSQGRGPAYLSVGRKIWHPQDRVEKWLQTKLRETEEDGNTKAQRNMALPVQARQPRVQRTTGLADTSRNESKARQLEAEHRQALLEGRTPSRRLVVREFADAAVEFLGWAKMEYRARPNSHRRIATSLTSAREFFKNRPVSTISEGEIEAYKVWRGAEHQVRDITIRHDLHALSTFFKYAISRSGRERILSAIQRFRLTLMQSASMSLLQRKRRSTFSSGSSHLMRNQGMRPEEITSLRKVDIDLERGQLHVRFGKLKAAGWTWD